MQRIFSAFIVFFLCINTSTANESSDTKYQLYFDSHMFGYSETAPIKQIVDDMKGPYFDGGDHSFTHNIWEMGVKRNGWKAAYIIRYDYALDYNPDTAEIIYGDKNDISLEKNRVYDVDLDLIHSRSTGFKLGYEWQVKPKLFIGMDVSYLETNRFLKGDVSGEFSAADNDYTGEISLDYVYTKDYLLSRDVKIPTGRGYTLDIDWRWQSEDDLWKFSGKWTDLVSEITIKDAPFTTATASTDRVSFDDDGHINVKPVLSGVEGYRKEVLRFPKQTKVSGFYQFQPDLNLGLALYQYGDLNFPSTNVEYRLTDTFQLSAGFDYKSDAMTLGCSSSSFNVSLTSDRLSLDRARTFGLDISTNVEF